MHRLNRLLVVALAAWVLGGCGSDVATEDGSGGSDGSGGGAPSTTSPASTSSTSTSSVGTGGGSGGSGGSDACVGPDAPGAPYTLRFRNDLDRAVFLPQGCGSVPEVEIALSGEITAGIHPESVDFCGFTCDSIFEGGPPPGGCSDCGPGASTVIEAGATHEYVWDRRHFIPGTAPLVCTGLEVDHECAFGVETPASTYEATVRVCDGEFPEGSCSGDELLLVPFELVIAADEDSAEIVIAP